jgi:1,2-diacylglycerol 3-alpha-glucosyltransferase
MRVALFTDTYAPQVNGVVSYLDTIIPQLSKKNPLILFAPGDVKKIKKERKAKNFHIYWIPASSFPFYEGYRMSKVAVRSIEKILKEEKIDIVHAHAPVLLGLQGMLIAKKMKLPIVATYHTHLPDYLPYLLDGKFPGFVNSISQKTAKGLIKFVYSMADVSTAPTNELVKELKKYGIKNARRLINGIDLKALKSSRDNVEKIRKRYSISANKKIILYVGRIGFEKRLEVLFNSMKRLKSKDCCLLVVGSGPQLENYKELVQDKGLKNVIFTGYIEKELLPATYESAQVFVSASDSETFGLTFIEAMAMGTPVIGVNKLGPRELIVDCECGYLIRPGSVKEMSEKIDKILKDPKLRLRMSIKAKERAAEFSIQESLRETLEIYNQIKKKKEE